MFNSLKSQIMYFRGSKTFSYYGLNEPLFKICCCLKSNLLFDGIENGIE